METYHLGTDWEFMEALSRYMKDAFDIECIFYPLYTGLRPFRPTGNYMMYMRVEGRKVEDSYVGGSHIEEHSIKGVIKTLKTWKLIKDQDGNS